MNPQASSLKPQAFTLLEVLLALFIFSLAVISLVEAINGTGRTTLIARRERQVSARLESFLLEATRSPKTQEGGAFSDETESSVQEGDVTYLTRTKPLELMNQDGQPLRELVEISVAARWTEGREAQEVMASTWVYRPLFKTQPQAQPQP